MDAVGGITTILTSEKEAVPTSIRRTLSADMSSRKWMEENGFKSKDSWKPIEEEKMKKELHAPPQIDVWTSILAKKNDECHAPPYVHPLVKRSGNSLSKQSLEVCTESLGSETGSEGFSSYPPSETSDVSDDAKEEETQTEQPQQQKKKKVVTSSYQRKDPLCRTRSFPPPLPSISKENGKSLHVRPHRDDGRLVLEAVSVTEQTNFRARRQDGRLILTFVVDPPTHELLEDDELLVNFGEDNVNGDGEPKYKDEEEEEEKSSVSKLSVLINKPVVLSNRTPTWSNKFSELVLFGEDKKEDVVRCPYGLARGSTYNVYEYFWRSKPTTIISPSRTPNQTLIIKNYTPYHQPIVSKEPSLNRDDEVGVDRVDSIVPWMRSCNEKRRSLLFWESPCIATPTS